MKNWVWLVVAGVVIYLLWRSRQKAIPQEAPPTERGKTPWIPKGVYPKGTISLTEEQIRKAKEESKSLKEALKKAFTKISERPSGLPEGLTGLGATGIPRRGKPKSEYERMLTHYSRFGTTKVPPRGTGLTRQAF